MFDAERVTALAARLRSGGWHRVADLDPMAASALLVLYYSGVVRYRQDHDGSQQVQWIEREKPVVVRTQYPISVFVN